MRRTVNIINFMRGSDPREGYDVLNTVLEEIKLLTAYGFDSTFLFQYDALIKKEFTDLFSQDNERMELGVWIEIPRPLCLDAGLAWRGRTDCDWDHHVNPGFLMSYTSSEKEKLIDVLFERFKSIFGGYPKSAGSWMLDSYSMQYMSEKYDIDAFCICRDQWGTDGYTLWGGYYNQGYYPCKNHMLHPAQTKNQQINTPVFRMLGSDPIYQYDTGFKDGSYNMIDAQGVFTMEPASKNGQNNLWVDWYFENMINFESMGFSYAQTGQENGFIWEGRTKIGYEVQMKKLKELKDSGDIIIEKLCDTGKWFKENYKMTPSTSFGALTDWQNEDYRSVWFNSKKYRANLVSRNGKTWFRDIHIFDENYRDCYLDVPCTANGALYECLPVIDGYKWGKDSKRAGIYLDAQCKIEDAYEKDGDLIVKLTEGEVRFLEDKIEVIEIKALKFIFSESNITPKIYVYDKSINYTYKSFDYKITTDGTVNDDFSIKSNTNKIMLAF